MDNTTVPEDNTQKGEPATKSNELCTAKPPSLSPKEFRAYNHMAQTMKIYHDHFRMEWEQIYQACCQPDHASEGEQPRVNTSLLMRMIMQFVSHLTMHHGIEEQHIFPMLGERMPEFRAPESDSEGAAGAKLPIEQHREIHAGLDKLDEYLNACRAGEKEFRRAEVRSIIDGFGQVLWQHLDDEVAHLGAENMKKYWTIEEMKMMPM